MIEPAKHIDFEPPGIGDECLNITRKAMIQCVNMLDYAIVQACIDCAKEEGCTDLYLLDRKFVVDALNEKIGRIECGKWIYDPSNECIPGTDAPLNYRCSLCGAYVVEESNYCPDCGKIMEVSDT